ASVIIGPSPCRKALASVSLGQSAATFLLPTSIRSHIGKKHWANSFMPKKNSVVYLKPSPLLLSRPFHHASQGAIVVTFGMPLASHWSATGLVVSGVDEPTIMSTLSLLIS